jgi:hypothetical protein
MVRLRYRYVRRTLRIIAYVMQGAGDVGAHGDAWRERRFAARHAALDAMRHR